MPSFRIAYRIGFGVFAVLILHALIFWKERMVMADAACYLFEMIRKQDFAIMHYRFIGGIPQLIPLAASRMHAPLAVVASLYSVAFPLYYLGCYAVCGITFRNYRVALVQLLFAILISTHTQYWMLSELSLGGALLLILFAAITSDRLKPGGGHWVLLLAAVPGLVTVAFSHPLLLFAFFFCVLFLWVAQPSCRKLLLVCSAIYLGALWFKAHFYNEPYEASAIGGMRNFSKLYPHYFGLFSNKQFLMNLAGKWWGISVCSAAIIFIYLRARQWYHLALFVSFSVGYTLLVNVVYPDSYTHELYIENFYLVLGFFIAFPLVWDVWPRLELRRIAGPAFVILCVCCLIRIWMAHRFYTARVAWHRRLEAHCAGHKYILSAALLPADTMLYGWCMPYESWLLSTIERKSTSSLVVHENPGLMPSEGDPNPRIFITAWDYQSYDVLRKPYFIFNDTVNHYVHIWEKSAF